MRSFNPFQRIACDFIFICLTKSPKDSQYCDRYGSTSYVFEIALERIGEHGFAENFIQTPQIKDCLITKITPPQTQKERPEESLLHFGWDSTVNANLCEIGLALTGLEEDAWNYYYLP